MKEMTDALMAWDLEAANDQGANKPVAGERTCAGEPAPSTGCENMEWKGMVVDTYSK